MSSFSYSSRFREFAYSLITLNNLFYFSSIELIETEVEGTKAFLEYLHQEPDLILHCQEIEAFCNNLLPKEDDPTETAAEA